MKKILTITLLVLLTVGLFVSCNANAVETVFNEKIKESSARIVPQEVVVEGGEIVIGEGETKGKVTLLVGGTTKTDLEPEKLEDVAEKVNILQNNESIISFKNTNLENAVKLEKTEVLNKVLDNLKNVASDTTAKANIEGKSSSDISLSLNIKLSKIDVATDSNLTITSMEFDVTPIATITVKNSASEDETVTAEIKTLLEEPIKFRLPVDPFVTDTIMAVYHKGEFIGNYDIKTQGNEKYVEIKSQEFSKYGYQVVNEKNAGAKIGDTYYFKFEDAVAEVMNNETILLLKPANPAKDIVFDKVISFKVDKNDKEYTDRIKAADGYKLTTETDLNNENVKIYSITMLPAFKAVYDTTGGKNTLTFYYDDVDHKGDNSNITVYDKLPTAATKSSDWGYNSIRGNVKSIVIDSSVADYHSLTSTAYMFQGMENAGSISGTEYLDTSNVTDMQSMFLNCKKLAALDISSFNTSKVEKMNSMFKDCSALETITFGNSFGTSNVTDMTNMFNGCKALAKLDLSNFNTASATTTGMFNDCSNLVSVKTTENAKIVEQLGNGWTYANGACARWGVTGSIKSKGFDWNKDVGMTETGNGTKVFESPVISLTTSDRFKLRFGAGWDINYGVVENSFGSDRYSVIELGKPINAIPDGLNMAISADGDYIITLNLNGEKATITVREAGKYTVTFGMNGITGTAPTALQVVENGKVAKPEFKAPAGYALAGWYKDSDCTTEWDFDKDVVDKDTTLYAKWNVKPFVFVAEEAGASVKLIKTGNPADVALVYSTDGVAWKDYTFNNKEGLEISAPNKGDKVYFRAKTSITTFSPSDANLSYHSFVINRKMSCEGNIMYLLDSTGKSTTVPTNAFNRLFLNCSNLTSAPELPATTLTDYCYDSMFQGCTSLTTAPELPAEILTNSCYFQMFNGCSNLNSATILATEVSAQDCLSNWLSGITTTGTLYVASGMETTLDNDTYRPSSWDVVGVITTVVFEKPDNLGSITINRDNSANIQYVGNYTVDYSGTMSFGGYEFYKDQECTPTPIESFEDLLELDSIYYLTTFPNEVWHKCDKSKPSPAPTFKAVYNTTEGVNTLTFYYDAVDHSGEGDVYDNLPTAANNDAAWGYNGVRKEIKKVVITESVKEYSSLTSTACMFHDMTIASSIEGAEYLDVSNVTNMAAMFWNFGSDESSTLNSVPDVKEWNTASVTNMQNMFTSYGAGSEGFNAVPDVGKWNTASVTNMTNMFWNFGSKSSTLNSVPDVKEWNTASVTNMNGMFKSYGEASNNLNKVPDVSKWNTVSVTTMGDMFLKYGYTSTALNTVPDVSGWNTSSVTTMIDMFQNYGYSSTALSTVPNVSNWKTGKVTSMTNMFNGYGYTSKNISCVLDLSGWDLSKITSGEDVFKFNPKTFNVTIPAKTGEKSNESGKWYYGDGTNSIAPPTGKNFTPAAKEIPVIHTIEDVLKAVKNEFPTSFDSGWYNSHKYDNEYKCYTKSGNLVFDYDYGENKVSFALDSAVTESSGNYTFTDDNAALTFKMTDGELTGIAFEYVNISYQYFNGTYVPPVTMTIGEILAEVDGFPAATKEKPIPDNAYIAVGGFKAFIDGDSLKFMDKDGGSKSIALSCVAEDQDYAFVYTEGSGDDAVTYAFTEMYGPFLIMRMGEDSGEYYSQAFTVTFDMKGHGTQISPKTDVAFLSSSEDLPQPESVQDYKFDGWYADEALEEEVEMIMEDTIVHAKWTYAGPVDYLEWDPSTKKMEKKTVSYGTDEGQYTLLKSSDYSTTLEAGKFYVVSDDATIYGSIVVEGTEEKPTYLILCDEKKLAIMLSGPGSQDNALIQVTADHALNICGQEKGTGTLSAKNTSAQAAIIGGNNMGNGRTADCGSITINGGTIEATGFNGAAIGGGTGGNGGTVTINGGIVNATSASAGAAIGSGIGIYKYGTHGGTVTINGGTVRAINNSNAENFVGAGIGGGECSNGAIVTINGGNVTAIGGNKSPGIGGGYPTNIEDPEGTIVAYGGNGGTVIINGGTVKATGGAGAAGIGGSQEFKSSCVGGGNGGTVIINGGSVEAVAGEGAEAIGKGKSISSGSLNTSGTVEFSEGVNFTINAGADKDNTESKTTAEYSSNHSAAYVGIEESAAPKYSTIADIIDTVDGDFPKGIFNEDSDEVAPPDNAWVDETNTDYVVCTANAWGEEDYLFVVNKDDTLHNVLDAIPLSWSVKPGKDEGTWENEEYTIDDQTYVFTIEDGKLTSITHTNTSETKYNGTYTAPAATPAGPVINNPSVKDGVVTYLLGDMQDAPAYDVVIRQNGTTYTIINLFGSANPAFNDINDLADYQDADINIDAADPNNVKIAKQNIGWTGRAFSEVFEIEASNGKLENSVITFDAADIIFYEDGSFPYSGYGNLVITLDTSKRDTVIGN